MPACAGSSSDGKCGALSRLRPLESHLLEFSTMGASLVIHCITPTDIRTCKPYVVANSAVAKKAIMPATTCFCWSPVNCGNMGNETISEAVLSATGKSPARYPRDAYAFCKCSGTG